MSSTNNAQKVKLVANSRRFAAGFTIVANQEVRIVQTEHTVYNEGKDYISDE